MNWVRREFTYHRQESLPVKVGRETIGGDAPILVQSMANVDTMDTDAAIEQVIRIADAGGKMVRFTAQGVKQSRNLAAIKAGIRERGYTLPLVADIHFNPKAAYAAAETVEKVRINPGNFVDPARQFLSVEYTDEEYAAELAKIERVFGAFLDLCKQNDTAIRLGVNHGSLSDRIMTRYGDTPAGMVESCMEYLRVCQKRDFHRVVISIKASNTVVMTETVRLLVETMHQNGMHYPLHLGVTEAGDAEDGRVKSAVGIGSLLAEGIGDTIRVSLSEEPEAEIPVAEELVRCTSALAECGTVRSALEVVEDSEARQDLLLKDSYLPQVVAKWSKDLTELPEMQQPDIIYVETPEEWASIPEQLRARCWTEDPSLEGTPVLPLSQLKSEKEVVAKTSAKELLQITDPDTLKALNSLHAIVLTVEGAAIPLHLQAVEALLATYAPKVPLVVHYINREESDDQLYTQAGFMLGGWLLDRYGAGIMMDLPKRDSPTAVALAFGLLQASRRRISKTEYISCPGCGRTLFGLQETIAQVKAATSHLTGLKIGIMGCIVNGPGEMADADYGYVGAGPGKIDLYRQKECVLKGIPQEEAVERLMELIENDKKEFEKQA